MPTKMNAEKVEVLRLMAKRGASDRNLAQTFEICVSNVTLIRSGKTWQDAPGPLTTRTRGPKVKISNDDVYELRMLAVKGVSDGALAKQFGIKAAYVSMLRTKRRRAEAGGPATHRISNGGSEITFKDAEEIRKLFASGTNRKVLGEMFGLSYKETCMIITGARWSKRKTK